MAERVLLPCCDLWCMDPAEFEINGGSGHFEDNTHACEAHVGSLLGTSDWLDQENREWIVTPLTVQPSREEQGGELLKLMWTFIGKFDG